MSILGHDPEGYVFSSIKFSSVTDGEYSLFFQPKALDFLPDTD